MQLIRLKHQTRLCWAICCLLTFVLTPTALAQLTPLAPSPAQTALPDKLEVQVTLASSYTHTMPGDEISLLLEFKLPAGFHLYSFDVGDLPYQATAVTVPASSPLEPISAIHWPPIIKTKLLDQTIPIFQANLPANITALALKSRIKTDVLPGMEELAVTVSYQACSETLCLPPVKNRRIWVTIEIVDQGTNIMADWDTEDKLAEVMQLPDGGATKQLVAAPAAPRGVEFRLFGRQTTLGPSSLILPLLVALLAGLVLNIMPCVLPVVPIKVMTLVAQARDEHRSATVQTVIFGTGIVLFFLALGTVAAVLGQSFAWGQHFRNPAFLIAISLLLVWLGLGMFGLYEVAVPRLLGALGGTGAKGKLSALGMGVLAGVLSTPCSFGILGAAIAWAQLQRPALTLLAFGCIGLGMAGPYVVLAAWPGLLDRLPKAGRWSAVFKQSMGFVLLGVALFLLCALPKDRLAWALGYTLVFSLLVWLWGVMQVSAGPGKSSIIVKLVLLHLAMASGWWMLRAPQEDIAWSPLSQSALAQAKAAGRPVVVDFTADWCLNCKTVDALVYRNAKTVELMRRKGVLALRGDLTGPDAALEKMLTDWTGQSGIPYTVVWLPGKSQPALLAGVFMVGGELRKVLETLPDRLEGEP